jgi:hypothetical protein
LARAPSYGALYAGKILAVRPGTAVVPQTMHPFLQVFLLPGMTALISSNTQAFKASTVAVLMIRAAATVSGASFWFSLLSLIRIGSNEAGILLLRSCVALVSQQEPSTALLRVAFVGVLYLGHVL